MIVVDVRCENVPQLPLVEDDDMVEALSTVPPFSAGWRCYPRNLENLVAEQGTGHQVNATGRSHRKAGAEPPQ